MYLDVTVHSWQQHTVYFDIESMSQYKSDTPLDNHLLQLQGIDYQKVGHFWQTSNVSKGM